MELFLVKRIALAMLRLERAARPEAEMVPEELNPLSTGGATQNENFSS